MALSALRERLPSAGAGGRVAWAVALLVLIAGIAAASGGGRASGPAHAGHPLEDLLHEGGAGTVVVDRAGRPVRGPDGKPLRVAKDGKTLLDGSGKPLRDARGRPLRLGPGNRLPAGATRGSRKRSERGRGRRAGPRRGRRRAPDKAGAPGVAPTPAPRAEPIRIGAAVYDPGPQNTASRQMGIDAPAVDPRSVVKAVQNHFEATGGVLGRRIRIETFEHGYLSPAKEICEHFTRTDPLAVVHRSGMPSHLVPCLGHGRIPVVASWTVTQTSKFFADHADSFFAPGGLALDRIPEPLVATLRDMGYFRGGRVGVIVVDFPGLREAGEILVTTLERAGIRVAERATYVQPDNINAQNARDAINQMSVVALRFKSAGVNRVLAIDANGAAMTSFLLAAERQDYFPRYGLNTTNGPIALAVNADDRRSLQGAVGVGWAPLVDVPEDPGPPDGNREECDRIFRAAGVAVGARISFLGQYTAYSYCDSLLMIRAALKRSGDASAAGLRRGMEALGSDVRSAVALETWLGPDRHDGVSGVRGLRYDGRCSCFRYE